MKVCLEGVIQAYTKAVYMCGCVCIQHMHTNIRHVLPTHLTVCDFNEDVESSFHVGFLLGGQKAVVLQDAQLYVSRWGLWLQLL